MGENYLAASDLMTLLHRKDQKRFRENYLVPAIVDGALEPMYPDTPRHPRQQYRLTEAALEWKNNQKKENC